MWLMAFALALAPLTALTVTAEETVTNEPTVAELQVQINELKNEITALKKRVQELESSAGSVDTAVDHPTRPFADALKERVHTMMQERKVAVCHNGNTLSVSVSSALAYKRAGEAQIGSCERWNTRSTWDDDKEDEDEEGSDDSDEENEEDDLSDEQSSLDGVDDDSNES